MRAMETVERPLTLVSLTESAAAKIKDLMAEEAEGEAPEDAAGCGSCH